MKGNQNLGIYTTQAIWNVLTVAASVGLSGVVSTFQAHAEDGLQKKSLSAICDTISTEFYDQAYNGVDWLAICDEAQQNFDEPPPQVFDAQMERMVALLQTSHTAYLDAGNWRLAILAQVFEQTPQMQKLAAQQGGRPSLRGAGYFSVSLEGKTFVDAVLPGSPAEKAGILAGDEIVSAGASGFRTVWPRDRVTGTTETEVTIRRTKGGTLRKIRTGIREAGGLTWLADATASSVRVINTSGRKIGYMRGWTMLTRPELGGPASELERALSDGTFADIDAVIFDARGIVGGGGMDVLSTWLTPRLPIRYQDRNSNGWIGADVPAQSTPLVVIIDRHTRSGAEVFAKVLRHFKIAPLVGATTAGALTGGKLFALPNGAALYVAVAGIEIGGEIVEGRGVDPTLAVNRPIAYAQGSDPQIDAAIREAVRLAEEASSSPK